MTIKHPRKTSNLYFAVYSKAYGPWCHMVKDQIFISREEPSRLEQWIKKTFKVISILMYGLVRR
jgi:hypothetical protein